MGERVGTKPTTTTKPTKPDALAPYRDHIRRALSGRNAWKKGYWRLAMKLGRLPTLQEEWEMLEPSGGESAWKEERVRGR
jgi:hypothetical protein